MNIFVGAYLGLVIWAMGEEWWRKGEEGECVEERLREIDDEEKEDFFCYFALKLGTAFALSYFWVEAIFMARNVNLDNLFLESLLGWALPHFLFGLSVVVISKLVLQFC